MGWVHSVGIPNVRRSTSEETNRVCVTMTGTHLFFPFYPSFSPTFSTLAIPFFFFFFLPFTPSLYPHPLFSFIILCPPTNPQSPCTTWWFLFCTMTTNFYVYDKLLYNTQKYQVWVFCYIYTTLLP